jgi:hypothetical protein
MKTPKTIVEDIVGKNIIRKLPGQQKWRLYSIETHKNLGTFPSKKKAIKHEMNINFFKHRG